LIRTLSSYKFISSSLLFLSQSQPHFILQLSCHPLLPSLRPRAHALELCAHAADHQPVDERIIELDVISLILEVQLACRCVFLVPDCKLKLGFTTNVRIEPAFTCRTTAGGIIDYKEDGIEIPSPVPAVFKPDGAIVLPDLSPQHPAGCSGLLSRGRRRWFLRFHYRPG